MTSCASKCLRRSSRSVSITATAARPQTTRCANFWPPRLAASLRIAALVRRLVLGHRVVQGLRVFGRLFFGILSVILVLAGSFVSFGGPCVAPLALSQRVDDQ